MDEAKPWMLFGPPVPTTDAEARVSIDSIDTIPADCRKSLVGKFDVRRRLGDSLHDAYKRALLALISDQVLRNIAVQGNTDATEELARRTEAEKRAKAASR